MQQGQAYGIVVDGFNGEFGQYTLSLTSSSVRTHLCTYNQPAHRPADSLQMFVTGCSWASWVPRPCCKLHDARCTMHDATAKLWPPAAPLTPLSRPRTASTSPTHPTHREHAPEPASLQLLLRRTHLTAALRVQGSVAGAVPPDGFGEGSNQPQVAAGVLSPSAAPVLTVPSQSPSQLPTLQGSVPPGVPGPP